MTSAELEDWSRRLLADYDDHAPGGLFAGDERSLTIQEAYALQLETARLRTRRGEAIAGYKIGCVSPAVQKQLGVTQPVFGHVFRNEVRAGGAALSMRDFDGLAIEGEFAVELARDVDDPERLREDPSSYVSAVFPIIELHNYVFRGPGPSAAELIANNALHAGIVAPDKPWPAKAAGEADVAVLLNGRVLGSTTHDPLATLGDLARMLRDFGIRPVRGQLLLTGSPLPLYRVEAGDAIEVRGSGSTRVRASVTA